jgi:hypothetical protein
VQPAGAQHPSTSSRSLVMTRNLTPAPRLSCCFCRPKHQCTSGQQHLLQYAQVAHQALISPAVGSNQCVKHQHDGQPSTDGHQPMTESQRVCQEPASTSHCQYLPITSTTADHDDLKSCAPHPPRYAFDRICQEIRRYVMGCQDMQRDAKRSHSLHTFGNIYQDMTTEAVLTTCSAARSTMGVLAGGLCL